MRILLSIITLCFCVSFADKAGAEYIYHSTYLVNKIKPNLTVRSKPTSIFSQSDLRSIKLASVQFLTDGTVLKFDKVGGDVKTQCASLGYVLPVSKCKSPLKPSYLCSADKSMEGVEGASDYTSGCCDSSIYTAASASECNNNATATGDYCYWGGSKKYRCACDKSRYPYSDLAGESCSRGQVFDVTNVCTVNIKKEEDGQEKTVAQNHYASCCKVSTSEGDGGYKECNAGNHEVGWGKSCRVSSGGTIKHLYEKCVCSSNYQTPCSISKLIKSDDYCKLDGEIYTRESNCESNCTYTSETNIDSYLQNKVWHCLYEKDGATIKDLEGSLCYNPRGVSTDSEENKKKDENYFDSCEAQGYMQTSDDCSVNDLILYCPNDRSKVWCLDGKHCSTKSVSHINGVSACNIGARLQGENDNEKYCYDNDVKYCSYIVDVCNKCWSANGYNSTMCDDSDNRQDEGCPSGYKNINGVCHLGANEKCCKNGFKMKNGICVVNECDRDKFPYEQNPGMDQGKLEVCYEGNAETGGHKAYFGYSECYSTNGGMWKQAGNTGADARKCVCERQDNSRGWLPFDLGRYFGVNTDVSDDYKNVCFNEGLYGEYVTCTDSEGSYYGYTSCYKGKTLGTNDSNKGMCLSASCVDYTTRFPFQNSSERFKSVGQRLGLNVVTTGDCVNYYTHCKSPSGKELGDISACELVVEGCLNGNEEACNECYHVTSLIKDGDLYKAHGKFKSKLNWCKNNTSYAGFETCPEADGYKRAKIYTGSCYKYCSTIAPQLCDARDILIDNGNKIGLIYKTNHNSGLLYMNALLKTVQKDTWENAKIIAGNYYPEGYENHEVFGRGKWKLPVSADKISYDWPFQWLGTLVAEGYFDTIVTWSGEKVDDNYANYISSYGNMTKALQTSLQYVIPMKVWNYKGG